MINSSARCWGLELSSRHLLFDGPEHNDDGQSIDERGAMGRGASVASAYGCR